MNVRGFDPTGKGLVETMRPEKNPSTRWSFSTLPFLAGLGAWGAPGARAVAGAQCLARRTRRGPCREGLKAAGSLGRHLSVVFCGAIVLLMLGPQVTPATASDGTCDSTTNYVLPAGQTLRFDQDLRIEAACNLVIEGSLLADPLSGASLILQAGRSVRITGLIRAGDGADGASARAPDGPLNAADGGAGGNVLLTAGRDASCADGECVIALSPGSFLSAGDGGSGGDATVLASRNTACACANAGRGGNGGLVFLAGGATPSILGRVEFGRAGEGGMALAGGPNATATGGDGGTAGYFLVEGYSPSQLAASSPASIGGPGGTAIAFTDGGGSGLDLGLPGLSDVGACQGQTGSPGEDGLLYGGQGGGAEAQGCPNTTPGTTGTNGDPGPRCAEWLYNPETRMWYCGVWSGSPTPGATGGGGSLGGSATATGGKGGTGLVAGGTGGSGHGTGGKGGPGGQGGKGGDTNYVCFDGARGGNGGKGGTGGTGIGRGGDGGNALLALGRPGDGGSGFGVGGTGGEGGVPGKGGDPAPFQPGFGGNGWSIGCASRSGEPGNSGDAGAEGSHGSVQGSKGNAGTMSLGEVVEYLESQLPP